MPARWKPSGGRALLGGPRQRPTGGQALVAAPQRPAAQPAPPTVGAPTHTALPIDPAYDAAQGAASFGLQTGLLGAQYQRGQLGQTFGLGIRPDGTVFDDPSNPYSRAAEL